MGKNASFSDCSKSNHQSVLTAVGERAPTLHRRCYQLAKQLVGKIYNFSSFSTNCVFFSECQFFQRENFSRFVLVEFEIKFDENPCRSDSRTEFHGGGKFAMHVEIYVSFFVFAISPFKCFFSPSS